MEDNNKVVNTELCTECEKEVNEINMVDDRDAGKFMCVDCAIKEITIEQNCE